MDDSLAISVYTEGIREDRYDQLPPPRAGRRTDPRPVMSARYTDIFRDAENARVLASSTCCRKRRSKFAAYCIFTEKTAAAHYTSPSPYVTLPRDLLGATPVPVLQTRQHADARLS